MCKECDKKEMHIQHLLKIYAEKKLESEFYKEKYEFENSLNKTFMSALDFYQKELCHYKNLGTMNRAPVKNINPHFKIVR